MRGLRERTLVRSDAGNGNADDFDWKMLAQINPDIVGWIRVSGTSIDLPVALPPQDKPRDWYLHHDAWRRYSDLGCPYLDVRCEEQGEHLLIFGHRLGRSNHMFTEMADAHEQPVFDALGSAIWYSRWGIAVFEPMLSLAVDKDDALIQRFAFDSPSDLKGWLSTLLERSSARAGSANEIALQARRVLTLVTCSETQRGGRRRTLAVFAAR